MTQQAVKNSAASGTKTNEHNDSAACVGTEKLYGYQDGIVETVRLALEAASEGKETIPPNIAGALGASLAGAARWSPPGFSRRTSLSDVARILLAAARENLGVHPVLAGVFASLLTGAGTCADAVSGSARQVQAPAPTQSAANARGREGKEDGIIQVSGYYTPDEAEALIGRIRDWLSGCRDRHRLADLMESIKREFHLYDSQLGELLGISDRLVGHVRHGRPSPFAKARFAEVFGEAGASTDEVSGSVRTQKGE